MGQKILLNLPEKDLEKVETLVKIGEFTSKTEVIRFAVKQLLYSEERMKKFEELTKELQKQTKERGMTRKEIEREVEEAKEQTRKLISQMR